MPAPESVLVPWQDAAHVEPRTEWMMSPNTDSLSRETRSFIVLIALLQGLLLWFARTGQAHHVWPFSELGGCICWYTLVLGVPSAMTLTVVRLRDAHYWQNVAIIGVALALLAAWAMWSATGAPGLSSGEVLGPYGLTTTLALFVTLPWLQCRIEHGRWCAPYADLFEHAWQNALTLALTLVFVGICWAVLTLWAELFALVKIDFFRDLFHEPAFVYLATGGMTGLGILIARTQKKPIRIARQIVLAVFTGLLPLIALIAVLFAISLVFTGIDPLWKTRHAAAILMWLVATTIVFANAVHQDGANEAPYPAWLRRVIDAGLLALPIFAAIALYALHLRIDQYGWTQERLWATLAGVVLAAYACGYAYAVLRRAGAWLALLGKVNIVMSLVVIALIAASNSPLLDPHRSAVNDQLARWRDGRTDAQHLDLDHLRFDSGRRGYLAVQALKDDANVKADSDLADQLDKTLKRTQRYGWRGPEEKRERAATTVEQIAAVVHPAGNSPAPDASLLQAVLAGDPTTTECRQVDSDCAYIAKDIDGDGSIDALLCNLGNANNPACQLWDHASGAWRAVARFDWYVSGHDGKTDVARALRNGEVTPTPKRWPDLRAAQQTAAPR